MEQIVSFGHWLALRRKACGLTQAELARWVGCAPITIRKIEADERRPSREVAAQLAEHLAIPQEEREAFVKAARAELRVDSLPVPTRPARDPPSPTISLPTPPTALLGRAGEVASVRECLLRPDVRLVTLMGPPGIGKTRLGLQVATELRGAFPDGVHFIPLAAISDSNLVISVIAQSLGVTEVIGQPLLERLCDAVGQKHLLLLLDNFEQILEAASGLAALLSAAPHLKMLVTSRTALRLSGEHRYAVPPLAVPDLSRLTPAAADAGPALTHYAAIDLFVQRARAVWPSFPLTTLNLLSVAMICARLDGLPLAIELAAARSRLLSPRELLSRLDRRLVLLTGGATDVAPRQQTLRRAIDWSYDLLGPDEKILFQRLGVFIGGCTFAAVETVCGSDWTEMATKPIDESMVTLLDSSLLRRVETAEGESRFAMLETIREYALERLMASGETDATRQRHAAYYLALAETAEPELSGAKQEAWLARLDDEHDNLRAALVWFQATDAVDLGLRLAGALWRFWWMRGYLREGRVWLAEFRARSEVTVPTAARAKALLGEGTLAQFQGDYAAAIALHEESLAISRTRGDRPGIAAALNGLAGVAAFQGNVERAAELFEESLALAHDVGSTRDVASAINSLGYAILTAGDERRATALFEESLALSRMLGDVGGIAWALRNLGWVAQCRSDYAAARSLYEESLALQWELGDRWGIAASLNHLGNAALVQRELRSAAALLEQSLTLFEDLGDVWGIAWTLTSLGRLALVQEDHGRAMVLYRQALTLFQRINHQWGFAVCLIGLAEIADAQRQPERAAQLFGAAEAFCETIGAPPPTVDRGEFTRVLVAARSRQDEFGFAANWTEGRSRRLELVTNILRGD